MILCHIFLAIILMIIPFFVGAFLNTKTFVESYLYGQVFLWAVFQALAVPMVLFRAPFIILAVVYMLVLLGFTLLGIKKIPNLVKNFDITKANVPLILALFLILGQMIIYFLGMHLDEDDARWIAEANDAITKNAMYLHNPAIGTYTGEFVGEVIKDVFSPWSMYIAFFATVAFGVMLVYRYIDVQKYIKLSFPKMDGFIIVSAFVISTVLYYLNSFIGNVVNLIFVATIFLYMIRRKISSMINIK